MPRVRWIKYAIIGGLTGSALATGYYAVSNKGLDSGQCEPWRCALPFLTVSGAFSGMFLAREVEAQRRALAPRVGSGERYLSETLELLAPPTAFAVRDSLLVAVGDSGTAVVPTQARVNDLKARALRRQAQGLAGLRTVDMSAAADRMLLGSGSAFYSLSLSSGAVQRLLPGAVSALAAGPTAGSWAVARGEWVTVQYENGTRDSVRVAGGAKALSWDTRRNAYWVGTDSGVAVIRMGAGQQTGTAPPIGIEQRFATPQPVRALAHGPHWIVAALGEGGVMGWKPDATSGVITEPVVLSGSTRFVYDVAMKENQLWIAAGSDGLVRVSLEPEWRVLGSTREHGYITGVRTGDGESVWVSELGQNRLRKLSVAR